jgi:hypothetical protein
MGVSGNLGVTLGIAFGTAETAALDEQFYPTFDHGRSGSRPLFCVHMALPKAILLSVALSAYTQTQGV